MLNPQIFTTLAAASKASQFALDMEGRQFGLQFAIVTDTNDPLQMRRIKVTLESQGGLTSTDWAIAMRLIPSYDPPIPAIGSSVIVGAINGDPHDLVWLGSVINQTNPQDGSQTDPVLDNSQLIQGDSREAIGGFLKHVVSKTEERRTEQNLTISCGQRITLQNDAGASLTLHESGAIVLKDAFGNKLTLGGQSGGLGTSTDFLWNTVSGNCNWNLGGNQLNITNAGDVTIASKSVAVLGAADNRGDILVTKGY